MESPTEKKGKLGGYPQNLLCKGQDSVPTLSLGEERTKGNPGHHSLDFSTWDKQSQSLGKKTVQNA